MPPYAVSLRCWGGVETRPERVMCNDSCSCLFLLFLAQYHQLHHHLILFPCDVKIISHLLNWFIGVLWSQYLFFIPSNNLNFISIINFKCIIFKLFYLFFLHTFDHILHVIFLFCLSYQSDNRILINISVNASSTHSGATTIKNRRQYADLLDWIRYTFSTSVHHDCPLTSYIEVKCYPFFFFTTIGSIQSTRKSCISSVHLPVNNPCGLSVHPAVGILFSTEMLSKHKSMLNWLGGI